MRNSLRDILPKNAERLRRRERLTVGQWLPSVRYRIGDRPYGYERFPFHKEIVEDMTPEQVFMKSAQVGMSEIMVIRVLYVAEHLGMTALYYLPDDNKAGKFSKTRVQNRVNDNPQLIRRKGGTFESGLMKVGSGSVFVLGIFTEANVISYSGDYIVRDEIDRSKQDHSEFAKDRIMASDLQWNHTLSQPSFPGYGVHKLFQDTDQHYWKIKCAACGTWNCLELDFPHNFIPVPDAVAKTMPDGATHYRGCLTCHARLDMNAGEWVARQSSSPNRGYHISQLYTQIKPPSKPNVATHIMDQYRAAHGSKLAMQRFTISVIGDPHGGEQAKITDEVLDLAEAGYGEAGPNTGVFMGVDVGDTLHIAVGFRSMWGRLHPIHFEATEQWDRLDWLWEHFRVAGCVIDAMPYKDSAKRFAARHRDGVWIQYFKPVRGIRVAEELLENRTAIQVVEVDRTESLDKTVEMLVLGELTLPNRSGLSVADKAVVEDVRSHLKMLIAEEEEDSHGNKRRAYLRGSRVKNHYGMALNSMRIAALELGIAAPAPMVLPVWDTMRLGQA